MINRIFFDGEIELMKQKGCLFKQRISMSLSIGLTIEVDFAQFFVELVECLFVSSHLFICFFQPTFIVGGAVNDQGTIGCAIDFDLGFIEFITRTGSFFGRVYMFGQRTYISPIICFKGCID